MRAKISVLPNETQELPKLRATADLGFFLHGITQSKCYCYWSVYLMFDQLQELEANKEYEVELAFVSNLAPTYFKSGDELIISEGHTLVAKGVIV
jgi:hypothetical protein